MKKETFRTVTGLVLAIVFVVLFGDRLACAANAQTLEVDYAKYLAEHSEDVPSIIQVDEKELGAVSDPVRASPVSFTLTTTVFDKYLGANGDVFHDAAVIQPDLFISLPHSFYADVWVSRADGSLGEDFGDELDLTVGWSRGKWNVSVAHFWIAPSAGSDVIQLQAVYKPWSFERGANNFTVDAKVQYYTPVSSDGPVEGTNLRLGFSHSRPLGDRWSLGQRAGIFWDSGAFGYRPGFLAEWNGSLMFEWKGMAIGPTIKFATPLDLDHDSLGASRSTQWAFGLTMSKAWN